MFIALIRTCPGIHKNILAPMRLQGLRTSSCCFSLMILSLYPTSKSAELTLSMADLALEWVAILAENFSKRNCTPGKPLQTSND